MGLDKTTVAIAIAIVLLSGAALVASETVHFTNDREIDVISRVNEEGSMIVIRNNDNPNNYLSIDEDGKITISKDQLKNWGGKVVGTPGITTIQHKMMEAFVKADWKETYEVDVSGLGMDFEPYTQNTVLNKDTVYYDTTFTSKAVWDQSGFMNMGIIWESVCSAIIYDANPTGKELLNTNQLSPGHACCVIAGNHTYLSSHEEIVTQFLASYIKSVDTLNEAMSDKGSENYSKLVQFVKTSTNAASDEIVKKALDNIKYTYGNDHEGVDTDEAPLTSLRNDIVKFAKQAGLIDKIKGLGYTGEDDTILQDYANTLVDDSYLSAAMQEIKFTERDAQISVACIKGDIHQIALQFGIEMGYFAEHKITVNIFQAPNGAGVATSIQNNAANIGFMGVPPITLITVNSGLNPMKTYELTGTLTDTSGKPLANTEFQIIANGGHTYTGTTDANGNFITTVLNGTFAVSDGQTPIICVKINNEWIPIDITFLERIDKDTNIGTLKVIGGA